MLVGFDWVEPVMLFILHVTCSCIPMHTFFLFNILAIFEMCWDFSNCLSLSPFFFCLRYFVSMAPKRKSIPSQNPLRSGASISSDLTPSSVQFRDENARKAFSENFSRQDVHSES